MSESIAILRFKANTTESIERIKLYLNQVTRPVFSNEVPAQEACLFEAMEFVTGSVRITDYDKNTMYAWFEFVELDEIERIFKACDKINGIQSLYAYYADDEECRLYLTYCDAKLIPIYSIWDDEILDKKLWEMDWDEKALEMIIHIHDRGCPS